MMPMNQRQKILAYMKEHKTITRREAALLGVMELSSRLIELEQKDGYRINSDWITVTTRDGDTIRVKQYWLDPEQKEGVIAK